MQEEIWKAVSGYEGIYEVSNFGKVRSLDRCFLKNGNKGSTYMNKIKGRILKPKLTKLGYYEHGLSNGVKRDMSCFRVNRLVAEAFIPNPNNYPVVHHKDHNKLNNHVDNLMWTTHQGNIQAELDSGHKWGNFKIGVEHHNAKYTDEQVFKILELAAQGIKPSKIAEIVGCNRPYVSTTLNNPSRSRACVKNLTP